MCSLPSAVRLTWIYIFLKIRTRLAQLTLALIIIHAEFTSRTRSSGKLLGSHPGSVPLITPFCKRSYYPLEHLPVCNYTPTFFVLIFLFSSVSQCPTPAKKNKTKPTNQTHKQKNPNLISISWMNGWVNETFLAALESYIFLLLVGGEYASLFLLMPSRDSHAFPTANLHGVYRCLLKAAYSPVSKPS